MNLLCFGISHQSAPLQILEPLSLGSGEMASFLRSVHSHVDVREVVGLSTCNRGEYYLETTGSVDKVQRQLTELLVKRTGARPSILSEHGYCHSGEAAARHLFRVASGIESLIVGELQILGQIRAALETAREAGTAGRVMTAFFTKGIHAARRVHQETAISRGNVSVASVAISIARRVFSDLSQKRALIVGAGDTGRIAADSLRDSGIGSIVISNRTQEHAQDLANEIGCTTHPFADLAPAVADADIVVCATGSQEYLIRPEHVARRRGRMLLLLDLSLPRNIDPACGQPGDVFHYGLEDLQQVASENRAQRQAEVSQAEVILDEELVKFRRWLVQGEVDRVVESMRHRVEAIRQQHLQRASRNSAPEVCEKLDRFSDSLLRSVLHDLTSKLRSIDPESESGQQELQTARLLFQSRAEDTHPGKY